MTDTHPETPDIDADAEGPAENFIDRNPLTALAVALFIGALAAKILLHPAKPATGRHDPLPE